MIKKIVLATAATASSLVALPAAAQAQGYYDGGRYERQYRGDRYDRYDRGYYNQRYDNRGYYGRSYGARDTRYYGRRCSGTTGTIVGGIAGALLGDAVVGRRGDGTAGALIGGALGALGGRAIDKGDCRR